MSGTPHYTQEQEDRVVHALKSGAPRTVAARAGGLTYSQAYRIARRHGLTLPKNTRKAPIDVQAAAAALQQGLSLKTWCAPLGINPYTTYGRLLREGFLTHRGWIPPTPHETSMAAAVHFFGTVAKAARALNVKYHYVHGAVTRFANKIERKPPNAAP